MNTSRIGILGGSFNPIHFGHIELAQKAHEQYKLPLVLLMPTCKSYYKDSSDYAAPSHRLKMAELAAKECGSDYLKASSLDLDRGGYTYTRDTIEELSHSYDEIFFIVGSDSLMYIDKWKDSDVFLKKCVILYGKRNGDTSDAITRQIDFLKKDFGVDIRELHIKRHPISSSDIRKRITAGMSINEYIPESVASYIADNNLYR